MHKQHESKVSDIYIAHISDDGTRVQTVEDHLRNVAIKAAGFAAPFGLGEEVYRVGLAHDIGKTIQAFLYRILHNGPKVDHSSAGAWLLANLGDNIGAMCVAGHHCGLMDFGSKASMPHDGTFLGRLKVKPDFDQDFADLPQIKDPPELYCKGPKAFSSAFLTRMLFSCLVDADFLDTEAFMLGAERAYHYEEIEALLSKFHAYIKPWLDQEAESDLNTKRTEILKNCLDKGSQVPTGLYSLTVPTGGGKTTASLGFALEHAKATGKQRIIYVVPYTSIIEQNADVFREILGTNNVLEHHASYEGYDGESDEELLREQLAAENWDAPVVVTTAVQFFETLYGNRSSKLRRLHNIANSVVIFDEAQMLPVAHLTPCVWGIEELVKNYEVTAVLCTATCPALDTEFTTAIEELQPNKEDLYEALRRVTLDTTLGEQTPEELARRMAERKQVLCIVNTRQAAKDIYDLLPEEGRYHLSTLMYPAHRRQVLQEIRDSLKAGLTVRLVSTSLIEAGVDVDFPCVMREVSGLDSILQAAGRCNREGKAPVESSIVYVFQRSGQKPPTSLSRNIGAFEAVKSRCDQLDSLDAIAAYFRAFYRLTDKSNMDVDGVVSGFTDPGSYKANGYSGILPFATVSKRFHFIHGDTRTVYIQNNESKPLLDAIRGGYADRFTYRKLGQYTVSLMRYHFDEYIDAGYLERIDEDSGILVYEAIYSKATGLELKRETGEGLFV